MIPYMLAGFGVTAAIVGGALTGPVVKRLGEERALRAGIVFGMAGFALMGLAATGFWFLVAIPVLALWGFINPALNGLMSRRMLPNEQGQLAGANSSIMAIASLIGPALYTESFAWFVAPSSPVGHLHIPGAPFLIASMLMVAALVSRFGRTPPGPALEHALATQAPR